MTPCLVGNVGTSTSHVGIPVTVYLDVKTKKS